MKFLLMSSSMYLRTVLYTHHLSDLHFRSLSALYAPPYIVNLYLVNQIMGFTSTSTQSRTSTVTQIETMSGSGIISR